MRRGTGTFPPLLAGRSVVLAAVVARGLGGGEGPSLSRPEPIQRTLPTPTNKGKMTMTSPKRLERPASNGALTAQLPAQARRSGSDRQRWLRASAFALAVSAGATLPVGATLGLSSATSPVPEQTPGSAGTVTLSNSAVTTCPLSNALPTGTATNCSFTAAYSGSVPAYVAVDVLVETQPGSGGAPLYNPSDPNNDLQVSITSPAVTYADPTVVTPCPLTAPSGSTCYDVDDELVSTMAFTASSPTTTFTVSFIIPTGSPTGYQGGAAQVVLTTHAVQSADNGSTSDCTAGAECDARSPGAGSPDWGAALAMFSNAPGPETFGVTAASATSGASTSNAPAT
jgi:hypothetical protein